MPKSLTLYRNGVLSVSELVELNAQETECSIRVKKQYVNDVVSSLSVGGKLIKQPQFDIGTTDNFEFKDSNFLVQLVKSFRGVDIDARVYNLINNTPVNNIKGKITSYDIIEKKDGEKRIRIWVKQGSVVRSISEDEIETISIADEEMSSKLDKFLEKTSEESSDSVQQVKFSVSNELGPNCNIKYFIPNSPWKMTYRLYDYGDKTRLDALAVINNNTEENWEDVELSVATGSPFLYDSKLNTIDGIIRQTSQLESIPRSLSHGSNIEYSGQVIACSMPPGQVSCEMEESVGVMNFFNSKDRVNIESGKASTVPLFSEDVDTKEVVYFTKNFKVGNNAYYFNLDVMDQMVEGICAIYKDDRYVGSAEFSSTSLSKPVVACFSEQPNITLNGTSYENITKTTSVDLKSKGFSLEIDSIDTHGYIIDNQSKNKQKILFRNTDVSKNCDYTLSVGDTEIVGNQGDYLFDVNSSSKVEFKLSTNRRIKGTYSLALPQLEAFKHDCSDLESDEFFERIFNLHSEYEKIQDAIHDTNEEIQKINLESVRISNLLQGKDLGNLQGQLGTELGANENLRKVAKLQLDGLHSERDGLLSRYDEMLKEFKSFEAQ